MNARPALIRLALLAGEQGYFVRSIRTVTRLAKMVRSTRPEGILLSDHLSAPHIMSFLGACVLPGFAWGGGGGGRMETGVGEGRHPPDVQAIPTLTPGQQVGAVESS